MTYRDSRRSRLVTSRYQNVQNITTINIQIDRHSYIRFHYFYMCYFYYVYTRCKLKRSKSLGANKDPILVQINRLICRLKKTLVKSSIPLSWLLTVRIILTFPPGLGTLLLQCLQTIATRHTHIFNPSLIMNSMVLPMWCCITALLFAFSCISSLVFGWRLLKLRNRLYS